MQKRVSKINQEKLTPALVELFDRLVNVDEVISIDKIELDIGYVSPEFLELELVDKITKALEKQLPLQLLPDTKGTKKTSAIKNKFQIWIQYLEKGTLPWQVTQLNETEWMEEILSSIATDISSKEMLKDLVRRSPQVIDRIIYQFQIPFFEKLIGAVKGTLPFSLSKVYFSLEKEIVSFSQSSNSPMKNVGFSSVKPFQIKYAFWKNILIKYLVENKNHVKIEETILNTLKIIMPQQQIYSFVNVLQDKIEKDKSAVQKILQPTLNSIKKQLPKTTIKYDEKKDIESKHDIKNGENKKNIEEELQKENVSKPDSQLPIPEPNQIEKNKIEKKTQINNEPFQKKIEANTSEPTFKDIPEGSGYYIPNAGMILMHPFISRFFKKFDLLEKGQFKDENARQRAIHLLQYLATGKTILPEYEMLFPKFLCALPFEIPIEREIEITEAEKTEGDNLLKAIISHWGVLGKATPDGLREGFLQRSGKLEKRQNGWHLQVENRTMDMLIDRLPWNLSMVQLPWMKELLRVEWY